MNREELIKIATECGIFPHSAICFATADGNVFKFREDARNHSKTSGLELIELTYQDSVSVDTEVSNDNTEEVSEEVSEEEKPEPKKKGK